MKKDIPGYEGLYKIDSNSGLVWSVKRRNNLSAQVNKKGYYIVSLYNGVYQKTFILHRIIAKTFIANPKNLPQVNHINGIKTDNRIENLEWVSDSENKKHAFRVGLSSRKGERHHSNKLTEKNVLFIKKSFKTGIPTVKQLAKDFNVRTSTIYNIKTGRSWSFL